MDDIGNNMYDISFQVCEMVAIGMGLHKDTFTNKILKG